MHSIIAFKYYNIIYIICVGEDHIDRQKVLYTIGKYPIDTMNIPLHTIMKLHQLAECLTNKLDPKFHGTF